MQATKRATIVGETTSGGAHPTGQFDVGQGFLAFIPHSRSISPITKTDWEGTGVIPDVQVPADQALQKAIELIVDAKSK
ncbi:hypothetical protein J41TS12_19030 [Paenibacillus antibioticophila]|uniref:Tail specific protease domain-containing protein n=2 Tax=Paenibacillus TaxID=44249 RepID=A0A919Y264_9BACL|nr:hypothetical protein J41TS12_19030 [Paenibacillus antibioticophila]GIO40923.1 hypothetical protein J41TS4_06810 [Paenibacillus apis]